MLNLSLNKHSLRFTSFLGTLGSLKKSPQPLMNTLVTTTLHPQTAASASAVVVTVEQPQTTSKQGFNVVQQNQTPVVQLMTHLPQQAPQVIEDDNTPVKGMFLGFARKHHRIPYFCL